MWKCTKWAWGQVRTRLIAVIEHNALIDVVFKIQAIWRSTGKAQRLIPELLRYLSTGTRTLCTRPAIFIDMFNFRHFSLYVIDLLHFRQFLFQSLTNKNILKFRGACSSLNRRYANSAIYPLPKQYRSRNRPRHERDWIWLIATWQRHHTLPTTEVAASCFSASLINRRCHKSHLKLLVSLLL